MRGRHAGYGADREHARGHERSFGLRRRVCTIVGVVQAVAEAAVERARAAEMDANAQQCAAGNGPGCRRELAERIAVVAEVETAVAKVAQVARHLERVRALAPRGRDAGERRAV